MDNLSSDYYTFFRSWKQHLLVIPNIPEEVEYYCSQFPIEGIILSGGNDIHPQRYDSAITKWPGASVSRDSTEWKLLEFAVRRKIPVLGICRGMQLINVFFGGKLVKNMSQEMNLEHLPGKDHLVQFVDEKIGGLLGKDAKVNSFHTQAVTHKTLAAALKVFAVDDEIIEGLYHPTLPIAGIQWHPERKSPDTQVNRKLMEAFVGKKWFWKR